MYWYWTVITRHFFDFKGRASRREYWMFILVNVLAGLSLTLVERMFHLSWPYYVYQWAVLLPGTGVCVRRLHDAGKSGWWMVGLFVPFLNFYVIYLLCRKSETGMNAWGSNPKPAE